jgi:threonyl-tRNA synthetase
MLILGEKEQAGRAVSLRTRSGEQKNMIPLDEYLTQVEAEVRPKTLE